MANLVFPQIPNVGDIYAPAGLDVSYQWNGYAWDVLPADKDTGPVGPPGPQGNPGPIGPQGMPGPQIRILGTLDSEDQLPTFGQPGYYYIVDGYLYQWNELTQTWDNVGQMSGADSTVPGPQGPEGPAGVAGPEGPQGIQGEVGPAGAEGATGPQGPAGVDGVAGPQGPIGETGPQGPQGIQGIEGPVGPQGIQGEVGPIGPVGHQGIEGPVGPEGPQGIPGLGITFIGRVATVADLPATATKGDLYIVEDTGNAWVWSDAAGGFEDAGPIVGPQGSQGVAGPQGPVGEVGPQGPAGVDGAVGPAGPQGIQGEVGPQGPAGVDGAIGPEGPAGTNGADGATGPAGPIGPEGPSAVSADANNAAKLGSDNLIFVAPPTAGAPLRMPPTDVSSFNGVDSYWYMDSAGRVRLQMPGSTTGMFIDADGIQTFSKAPICNPAPTDPKHLANKEYVDSKAGGGGLPTTGGTMTGTITLPTTVQSFLWGTSTYNMFGASGGVAIRYGTLNIANFTATGTQFYYKVVTPASGTGIEFGSGGATLSRSGTNISVSTLFVCPTAPTDAAHLTNKSYVDSKIPAALADYEATIAELKARIAALEAKVQ